MAEPQKVDADRRTSPDALYREQVLRARARPPEQRLLDGLRLFERSCRIMEDGIRHQYPRASPAEVRRTLSQRLALIRRLEGAQ
jgi:hypothetical protein